MRCRSRAHGRDFAEDLAIAHAANSIGGLIPLLDGCIPSIAILISWRLQTKRVGRGR